MCDDGYGERCDDSRRIDGIGHRQKSDDVFALERKVSGDDADGDNKQADNGNSARVQNVASENGSGVDEASVG